MKNIKKLFVLLVLISSFSVVALFGFGDDVSKDKQKTAQDCEIPTYAKMIGHEDKWLLHNGCPPRKDIKKEGKKEK